MDNLGQDFLIQGKMYILNIIKNKQQQPTAEELLDRLIKKYGWIIRGYFREIIQPLRCNSELTKDQICYINSMLSDDSIQKALKGDSKRCIKDRSTIDELFHDIIKQRSSEEFVNFIEFSAKFREYKPFNYMLVRLQRPGASFIATARDWKDRFDRTIKSDANPIIILAPMQPVMCVYDVEDTEGAPLPENLERFSNVKGQFNVVTLERTKENCKRDRILLDRKLLEKLSAGFVTTCLDTGRYKMRIVINSKLSDSETYSVLCHELAHIYLGHLGGDRNGWWPARPNLNHNAIEIEAESVAYLVCKRIGLETESVRYLSLFSKNTELPSSVSIDMIMRVAGKIEEMGNRIIPERRGE